MPILIPVNICFALITFSMFISAYHREKYYFSHLFIFLLNALVVLYVVFNYFGLLK